MDSYKEEVNKNKKFSRENNNDVNTFQARGKMKQTDLR